MLSSAPTRLLFACAIFLASFLLFLVEPMVAKQLLPVFGGSAAVWITCLVFFQTALVVAYLYAHWLSQKSRAHRSRSWAIHLILLLLAAAASVFWIRWASHSDSAISHPVLAIFTALATSIGLPFLILGSTSPLLQVWLARIERREISYRLFALSNFASLLALGLYPTLIEPNLTLHSQRLAWTSGFGLFAMISIVLIWKTRSAGQTLESHTAPSAAEMREELPPEQDSEIPSSPVFTKLLWILLPMGAAMQLCAVTSHITENIAAIPLLWILPLAVYLITLILAFEFPRLPSRWLLTRLLAVLLGGLGYLLTQPEGSLPLKLSIGFFLAELLVACFFLHSEAHRLRPGLPSETTLFYLLFASGGAIGSFLIGIASPLLFRFNYDLAISFFVTALLAAAVLWNSILPGGVLWGVRGLWTVSSLAMLGIIFFLNIANQRNTPVAVRNFYGSLRVKQIVGYPGATIRTLSNGTIQHGTQIFTDELRRTPTTYYAKESGVGLAIRFCCQNRPEKTGRNIGVVGLGAGTIAAYGEAGDRIRFYEINPAVAPIANNLFTYIRDATQAGARISIVDGDARTSLAAEPAQQFDVLVIDAFSGDAIPLHLLTARALEIYKLHLAPNGILAFHISNQHVDLEPEIVQLAKAANLQAMRVASPTNDELGAFSSTWMLMTNSPTFFRTPEVFNHAAKPRADLRVRLWTDDYSSLLPLLH